MTPGQVEYEHGVPIPGVILPEPEWARTAVKRLPEQGPLDWPAVFGRSAPVVLELGCGNGRFTLASAIERPGFDHFAIDILPVVIRYATRRANQRGLHHVRFAVKDAQTFLARYVAPATIAEIHVYHPQPYHDPRQAWLRLLAPSSWRLSTSPSPPVDCSSSRPITRITGNTSHGSFRRSSNSRSIPARGRKPRPTAAGARSWRASAGCRSIGEPAAAATTSTAPKP